MWWEKLILVYKMFVSWCTWLWISVGLINLLTDYVLWSMWFSFSKMLDHVVMLYVLTLCKHATGVLTLVLLLLLVFEYISHLLGKLHDSSMLFLKLSTNWSWRCSSTLGDLGEARVLLELENIYWDSFSLEVLVGSPRSLQLVMDMNSLCTSEIFLGESQHDLMYPREAFSIYWSTQQIYLLIV